MATRMLRRGLPRVIGGEPWPPADAVAEVAAETVAEAAEASSPVVERAERDETQHGSESPVGDERFVSVAPLPRSTTDRNAAAPLRRGLPRVVGGEPWPPADAVATATPDSLSPHAAERDSTLQPAPNAGEARADSPAARSTTGSAPAAHSTAGGGDAVRAAASSAADPDGIPVRRGLPRAVGGDPWPPAGTVPLATATVSEIDEAAYEGDESPVVVAEESAPEQKAVAPIVAAGELAPIPFTRTVWHGSAPRHAPAPASDRRRPTWTQAIAGLLGAAALGILAGAAVAFVRALLSMPFMQDFLAAFPGEYDPAIEVAPGFAPWIGWQHFFNMFLIVLIIRSGLRVRTEKRPTVFWAPRGSTNGKGKISLTLWFHQALDILWLVNGVTFVVLIFVTGHWVRIVPTSWEVLPNALSAALQYVSFNWPTEHGWVNYNSLQQLAYFTTVFLAAPLAAATGFRMSGMWPKKAERLSKAYPVEWARAVHFPVMLYFVAFIIGHVALVFLTGFLRNLNHMFASSDAVGWTGFWVFTASLVVIIGAWIAARPLVLAPIAKLFGNVSGR
ncbi:cytochrome b/b6 domain-containing protein [Microbacterium sp. LWH12-1.2]|uniref:cytochrome b/b6 domain-containing protein n=1 Tax=Microbacterium sp. LWH12-1.2 TaxID=3135259 RepID=UPI0034144209